ncbi:MAG: hypothetical protein WC655_12880 [Candidatus Hydrogenedentales bacterium]|jgi:hypothetical protein
METVFYEEKQMITGWIIGLIVTTTVGTIGLAAVLTEASQEAIPLPLAVGLIVFTILLTLNFCAMRTVVRKHEVYVRFGLLIPYYWQHIPLDQVRVHSPVTYRPLRDAGGWGIRFGKFDGRTTTFFNMRGNEGVFLDMEKHPYIIGSQDPKALARAIEKAR